MKVFTALAVVLAAVLPGATAETASDRQAEQKQSPRNGADLPESVSSTDHRQAGRALYAAMQEHRHLGNGKDNGTGKGPPIALPQPSKERLTSLKEKQAKSTIAEPYALGLVEGYTIDASTTNELCVVAEGSDGVRIHVQAPTSTEAYVFCDSNEEASKLEFGDEGETWSPTCPGEEICLQVMSESGEGDVQITEHTYVPSESESIRRRLGVLEVSIVPMYHCCMLPISKTVLILLIDSTYIELG